MFTRSFLLLLATPLAACASQVDSDHQGQALATLQGEVRNTRTKPITGTTEVAVVWANTSGDPDVTYADTVPVSGSFPAQFELSIYTPPPASALNEFEGVQIGVAVIVAGDPAAGKAGLLGMEEQHLLVYAPADVPANSTIGIMLHSAPTAGFHLYGVHRPTDAEKANRESCEQNLGDDPSPRDVYLQCGGSSVFDDFVPLPTDLQTPLEIPLVDDPSQINAPNWT